MNDRTQRALVPLAPGFEEVEALTVVDVLRRAGVHVVTASVGATNPIVGRNRIRVMADLDLAEALGEWGDDWDVIVVPGGLPGVQALEADGRIVDLVRHRLATGRLTAAICAAPRILLAAGMDPSTPVTGHPACRNDMAEAQSYREAAVVRTESLITSRGPGTAMAFALEILDALQGPAAVTAMRVQLVV